MVNVIIKSDERKNYEERTRRDYTNSNSKETRELAECIAARSMEAIKEVSKHAGS